MKLKIAIVAHGRFHAFDTACALLQRGHDVTLFTNYPRWAVKRFGFPQNRVRSCWLHGVISRVAAKLHRGRIGRYDEWLHTLFGSWAATELAKDHWDVVHSWSGVSEEILQALATKTTFKLLNRSSAHIVTQARLLEEEERRIGKPQDRPSQWMVAREQREYDLADAVAVQSTFSYSTFVEEGFQKEKLRIILSGVSLGQFRPGLQVIEDRRQRILSGAPLRILNVGTFSFRKGMWDLAEIIRRLSGERFDFRFVGPVAAEAQALAGELSHYATFIPKRPQSELPAHYAWGDIFILPTIEDGFQSILVQAAASAVPILTTPNGAGRDLVREGVTGWVLPIRRPDEFVKCLLWCDEHRQELASMVWRIYNDFKPRDWADVAADFESTCLELDPKRSAGDPQIDGRR
ncbi:MAG: glycosyltransferase family 4 protein [Acidobacteria bacterium]|nr:glycosyltransferase family 4 protein [Acidobacteriota bacterium]